MPYEFIPVLFGVTLLFGFLAYGLTKRYLDDKNKMQLREMAHQERLKAIEQEVPLVEISHENGLDLNGAARARDGKNLIWLRLASLCLGLASTFGGVGMLAAFALAGDPEMKKVWPIGLIPAMIGLGLLLFYAMSRSAGEALETEELKG